MPSMERDGKFSPILISSFKSPNRPLSLRHGTDVGFVSSLDESKLFTGATGVSKTNTKSKKTSKPPKAHGRYRKAVYLGREKPKGFAYGNNTFLSKRNTSRMKALTLKGLERL